MSQKTRFTQSALAVAVALVSTQAWSAGFQLNEFSSSGLGRAYSGEGAIADDAGNASRNPALIMMFDRPTMSAGAIFIDPDVNISGKSPSGKSLNADNIAPTAWVPNLHYVAPINDRFGWGASITSNYGLATEYADDYAAGTMGGQTDLTTVNLNLSGAYRLNDHWSLVLALMQSTPRRKLNVMLAMPVCSLRARLCSRCLIYQLLRGQLRLPKRSSSQRFQRINRLLA